jgi:hypothetical protein
MRISGWMHVDLLFLVSHTYIDGKAREEALFEERRRQYEELAEKDDANFKDTVEMAEQTGGWVCVFVWWFVGRPVGWSV